MREAARESYGLVTARPLAVGDRRGGAGCAGGRGHRGLALRAALHGGSAAGQFYEKVQPQPALAQDYPRVLGVAHNAGNNLGTLATALHYGADVIEIDVISARGQLVAGRDQPLPWLARQLFRGPTLAEAWDRAAAAEIVKLDLKQTGRAFLNDLVTFVAPRASSRRVMISSDDQEALLYLHTRLPDVTLLFSVAGPDAVHQLQSDPALQKAIGGASVFQGLVDANLVSGRTGTNC